MPLLIQAIGAVAQLNTAWNTENSSTASSTGPAIGFMTMASSRISARVRSGSTYSESRRMRRASRCVAWISSEVCAGTTIGAAASGRGGRFSAAVRSSSRRRCVADCSASIEAHSASIAAISSRPPPGCTATVSITCTPSSDSRRVRLSV